MQPPHGRFANLQYTYYIFGLGFRYTIIAQRKVSVLATRGSGGQHLQYNEKDQQQSILEQYRVIVPCILLLYHTVAIKLN